MIGPCLLLFQLTAPPTQTPAAMPPPNVTASLSVEDRPAPLPTPTPIQDVSRFVSDHAVTLLVQTGEGRLIRKGQAMLSTSEGYVMTSLDLVAGGSSFVVSGGVVGESRPAKALAVSRRGKIAILQLDMKSGEHLGDAAPRTDVPPGAGDKLFALGETGRVVEGKVASISEDPDTTRLLHLNLALAAGAPLFNFRGQFVGVVRTPVRKAPGSLAVFVPAKVPGDWVDYFPSSVRDPIHKKVIEAPPSN
ncbi:MAG: trypsin-like peptidase domain-containing protein [Acidobacteriota bacterium]|nr:trypsin-like peptidase domain-containing protein [Acidobacteriota bacterium]